ncbi:CatB-related O-acetyltransferase [Flammeovirga sp. EKP202]|uniref:CatB-related O-acetyltransferase n=1 Tax=Flammeovirga sp. EKP202 TaxID=2770592 RepID=UPI0016600128|nr:CatB-related O-acetyltransferase [Flammeovirga sp. EKP202]MBD0401509.1 CatB-related O-acetyltransferase [Flammeovirga sp. EKP202]
MNKVNFETLYPIAEFKNTVSLKVLVEDSGVNNVIVDDYSYYSDFDDPTKFLEKNVMYNFGISGTALKIGKFCAIAHGAKFIMADANHSTKGVSTFPFAVFGSEWSDKLPIGEYPFKQYKDIEVGNDVWIGYNATIMPNVKIGDGAIIGSNATVTSDVPDYAIVGGNPAKVIRYRYTKDEIHLLKGLKWWDWERAYIDEAIEILVKGTVEDLLFFATKQGLIKGS